MMLLVFFLSLLLNLFRKGGCDRFEETSLLFDPSGKILQLEYAKKAISDNGGPVICTKAADGMLLLSARMTPKSRLIKSSQSKVFFLEDDRILIAVSGLTHDALRIHQLIHQCYDSYKEIYSQSIPIEKLCNMLSGALHDALLKGQRPLAVQTLIAGYDHLLGHQIYTLETDGTYNGWKGIALGKEQTILNQELLSLFTTSNEITIHTLLQHWKEHHILSKTFFKSVLEDISNEKETNHFSSLLTEESEWLQSSPILQDNLLDIEIYCMKQQQELQVEQENEEHEEKVKNVLPKLISWKWYQLVPNTIKKMI
jgi:20S proteasome alpha/beta subunit